MSGVHSAPSALIDLGAWASERYRVPVVEDPGQPEALDPNASPGAAPGASKST